MGTALTVLVFVLLATVIVSLIIAVAVGMWTLLRNL